MQGRIRVLSVQEQGKPAVTPLTNEAVLDFNPASGALTSLTQTMSVTAPGPPATSRQARATWTQSSGQTVVSHIKPPAPSHTFPGMAGLRLVAEGSGRLSIQTPALP